MIISINTTPTDAGRYPVMVSEERKWVAAGSVTDIREVLRWASDVVTQRGEVFPLPAEMLIVEGDATSE